MVFAFALLIVAVSCDVAHLKSNRPSGYNYPKPEGERLELPKVENDYLPPSKDEVVPEAPEVSEIPEVLEEASTTTTAAPSIPSNEYLPAADPITNDYLLPSADEPICAGSECDEQTTAANEVIV